jgi:nicotinamide phosphoribosyltransferase
MFKINPILAIDVYKIGHILLNAEGTTKVYCNLTPRNYKYFRELIPKGFFDEKAVVYGLTATIRETYELFQENFFNLNKTEIEVFLQQFKTTITPFVQPQIIDEVVGHMKNLYDLGYLPLVFKILPEGTKVGANIPMMTWCNTHDSFYWLPNYLETWLSSQTWKLSTCATLAKCYRNIMEKYATITGTPFGFVDFQGHSFADRGMSGYMDAARTNSAHSTSFLGTDSIGSVPWINYYYNKKGETPLVGASVLATEHSIACNNIANESKKLVSEGSTLVGEELRKESEIQYISSILKKFPTGILSYVADTYTFWGVVTEFMPRLKQEIMARQKDSNGFCKLVLRPDSGCPEDIICGTLKNVKDYTEYGFEGAKAEAKEDVEDKIGRETPHGECGPYEVTTVFKYDGKYYELEVTIDWNRHDKQFYFIDGSSIKSCKEITLTPEQKGAVECLDEIFGHTLTDKGYKQLDEHIGIIYGDSISPHRAYEILDRLEKKGYASGNVVLGIGSFTYQFLTRDTMGFAIKATYAVVNGEGVQLYKEPKTDPGKNSAKGMMRVEKDKNGEYYLIDKLDNDEGGCLQTIFKDGKFMNECSFEDIRNNLKK